MSRKKSPPIPTEQEAASAMRIVMRHLGIPTGGEYERTPARYLAAMREMLTPPPFEAPRFLSQRAESGSHMLLAQAGIAFGAVCAHHLFPFWGTADVVYLPASRTSGFEVLGLSKLARIVSFWAAYSPQLQERLTAQIAADIGERAEARGVLVVTRAEHGCMKFRGPKQSAVTVAEAATGLFLRDRDLLSQANTMLSRVS